MVKMPAKQDSGNMAVYNRVRSVPAEAQKKITGGRLNGFTDINPMWRIKILTEVYGQAGFGWYYRVSDKRIERADDGTAACFVDVELYVKDASTGEWSAPIYGTGGSMYIAKQQSGLYVSDECYKMATTDAISVACKSLGIGADVYWSAGRTKYDQMAENNAKQDVTQPAPKAAQNAPQSTTRTVNMEAISEAQAKRMFAISQGDEEIVRSVISAYGYERSRDVLRRDYDAICDEIAAMVQ